MSQTLRGDQPSSNSQTPIGAPIHVDFSQVESVESYVTIPEGRYLCRVAEVREGETRTGALRWAMRLEVADGDLAGRTAAWDGLVWSDKGLGRVKHVLSAMGFDVSGTVDLQSSDLLGTAIFVEFFIEEWTDPVSGRRTERLAVPYLGYEPAPEDAQGDSDSPF